MGQHENQCTLQERRPTGLVKLAKFCVRLRFNLGDEVCESLRLVFTSIFRKSTPHPRGYDLLLFGVTIHRYWIKYEVEK